MISSKNKFLFIHIPKTAGNSIQSRISKYSEDEIIREAPFQDGLERFSVKGPCGLHKHSTLADYYSTLGRDYFNGFYKFSCIRNPWDRAISFYFSPHRSVTDWDRDSFISFLPEIPCMSSYLYSDRNCFAELTSEMDSIIRYENLESDYRSCCSQIGIPFEGLPIRNKSKEGFYKDYYDPELINIVGELFAVDIKNFGYSF